MPGPAFPSDHVRMQPTQLFCIFFNKTSFNLSASWPSAQN
jgi:hypothetical protein